MRDFTQPDINKVPRQHIIYIDRQSETDGWIDRQSEIDRYR